MATLNRVQIVGNLTRDPELRYTPSGAAVTDFAVAINRKYRDESGNTKEDVTFVELTAWGKLAEVVKQHLAKGRQVLVEGRLHLDQWTTKDGKPASRLKVVATGIQFLGAKPAGAADAPEVNGADVEAPF